jgi:hypothetical protein
MMALSSWLFIREQESIWIERPYGFSVIVAGPGSAHAHLVFPNEDALQAHQVATAERLTQAGWFLWGFDQERRERGERVATPPTTPSPDRNRPRRHHRDSGLARIGVTLGSGRK